MKTCAFRLLPLFLLFLSLQAHSQVKIGDNAKTINQGAVGTGLFTVRGNGDVGYSGTLDMGVIVDSAAYSMPANFYAFYIHGCPTGYKMLSGGGGERDINNAQANFSVQASGPNPSNPTQWRLLLVNKNTTAVPVTIYTICAKVK